MFTPPGQDPTTVRTVLFVFILAMLASLCSSQMAHGAERFMSAGRSPAALSVRPEARVTGDDIRLRDLARWGDADKAALDPIGDLIVARFGEAKAFRVVAVAELKTLLGDAGVNLSTINFVGPTACRVERTDATFATPAAAIDQYTAVTTNTPAPATAVAETPQPAGRSLRDALTEDLARRLDLPLTDMQMTFRAADEAALRRREPKDTFDIRPQRAGDLGDVSWVVVVSGEKSLFVTATARAWRQQTVVKSPLAIRQPITEADVVERRQLVDRIGPDPLLAHDRVVGQAAARDLKPGMVVTARMVDAVRLVQAGQDVTVESAAGAIRLVSAARCLSDGTMGQNVQLRNVGTNQTFYATVTGAKRVSVSTVATAGSLR